MKKIVCLLLAVSLNACGPQDDVKRQQIDSDDSIAWHKGNVDDAFALAKQESKPLYFYWGAEWCPPCQEIKHTVFKHPKFISLSELFIPVYLDGDTEQAQLVGERFAVQGYPTMIVFASNGEEITRIPGGIDTRRYLDILSLSLQNGKHMATLITQAKRDPASLSSGELTQLAYYSWWQDNLTMDEDETLALLNSLATLHRPVDQLALSRLLLTYLALQTDLDRDQLNDDEKAWAYAQIQRLLASADTVLANIDLLSFYPNQIVSLLDLDEVEQQQLISLWETSVQRQRDNPLLSKAERLATWLPAIHFFWLQNPDAEEVPTSLHNDLMETVADVNQQTRGDERQSVINRAGNVLRAAKMYPEASELIREELAISKSPYYFMSSMAEIAEETQRYDEAIEWRQQAYAGATGKATRFQWGVEYVITLIEYAPDQTALIATTANGLFDELDRASDIFTGRNYSRLETLLSQLTDWDAEASEQVHDQFIANLHNVCTHAEPESQPRQRCSQLLTTHSQ